MKKSSSYWVRLGLAFLFTALAVLTVLPLPAQKPNGLGYFSHCPFAPWSTLIMLALAGVFYWIRARRKKAQTPR